LPTRLRQRDAFQAIFLGAGFLLIHLEVTALQSKLPED